ncbi:MAG: hypothetical protein PVJ42_09640, partial [bacterium]
ALTGSRYRALLKPATIIALIVLFAIGAFHWAWFVNFGDVTFRIHDWGQEHIYYSVLRQAANTGSIPFHMSMRFHQTDRFMSIPDTNFMPWVLVLPAMSVGRFIMLDLLILYALGFLGSILLMRKYNLSVPAFTFFFLIFNFNGHIVAHLAVGHTAWSGYFLLPFLFLFLLEMLEGKATFKTSLKVAFILFAMMLKGSFHLYTWCLMFLVFLLIFNWKYSRAVLAAIVGSALLSAFKLIPAAYTLLGRQEKFIWSYPTFRDLIDALITIRVESPERLRFWGNAGWWELDIYVGLIGLALLVYFGIVLRFSRSDDLRDVRYGALDLPILLMVLFSISYFHAFLTRLPIPLLRGERVATRFVVLPVLALALLASFRISRVLRRVGMSLKAWVLGIAVLAAMALGFLDHSFLWSVSRLERVTQLKVEPPVPGLITRDDAGYKLMVIIGMLITLAGLIALAYTFIRPRLKRNPA